MKLYEHYSPRLMLVTWSSCDVYALSACRPVLNFSELQNVVSKLEKLPCSIQHKEELMVRT